VKEYERDLEQVKIRDGLRIAMEFSGMCNTYFQTQKPWELAKTNKARCEQVLHTSVNMLYLLCALLEPYLPSFSAKVYEQMAIKRSERDEKLFEWLFVDLERVWDLVAKGH